MGRRFSTEQPDEPARLPPRRYLLGLLTPKKDGCTMTMLLARGVKVETIDELLAAGLAIKKSEVVAAVGRLRSRESRSRTLGDECSNEARRFGIGHCAISFRPQGGLVHR